MNKIQQLEKALNEAQAAYQNEANEANELALLRAEKAYNEALPAPVAEVKDNTVNIADVTAQAVAKAMKQANMPPQRPTKTRLKDLVKCDEVKVTKSEKDGSLIITETLREGVVVQKKNLPRLNRVALRQSPAKVFVPQKGKEEALAELSKATKKKK